VLGCGEVRGCDIDPKAPEVALRNAALNGIAADDFKIYRRGRPHGRRAAPRPGRRLRHRAANIVSDVIIPLSPLVPGFLAEGGVIHHLRHHRRPEKEVLAALRGAGSLPFWTTLP
jgi:ribosomal protein L11 methyltransferase